MTAAGEHHPSADAHIRGVPEAKAATHLRSIGDVAADVVVADLMFRALVERIHERGPRFLCEFLAHIAADRSLRTYLQQLADRFLALDGAAIEILGANQMPPAPLTLVVDHENYNRDRSPLDVDRSTA